MRHNWRHDWAGEDTLARGGAAAGGAGAGRIAAAPTPPPHFVAETFYCAMRAFQVRPLQILPTTASPHMHNPRFFSKIVSHDVASNFWQVHAMTWRAISGRP